MLPTLCGAGRHANGRTVMLFHGMNFGGFYFFRTLSTCCARGFRVVVPDQIGFGRSSKPIMPYNFHDMAANSRALLQKLGITQTASSDIRWAACLTAILRVAPNWWKRVIYNPIGTPTLVRKSEMAQRGRGLQGHDGADSRSGVPAGVGHDSSLISRSRRVAARVRTSVSAAFTLLNPTDSNLVPVTCISRACVNQGRLATCSSSIPANLVSRIHDGLPALQRDESAPDTSNE